MADIGNTAATRLLLSLGGSWLVARGAGWLTARGRHSHPKVPEYTRRSAHRVFGVAASVFMAAFYLMLGGADRWLFAPGIAADMITPWSIVSLHPMHYDRWGITITHSQETQDA